MNETKSSESNQAPVVESPDVDATPRSPERKDSGSDEDREGHRRWGWCSFCMRVVVSSTYYYLILAATASPRWHETVLQVVNSTINTKTGAKKRFGCRRSHNQPKIKNLTCTCCGGWKTWLLVHWLVNAKKGKGEKYMKPGVGAHTRTLRP